MNCPEFIKLLISFCYNWDTVSKSNDSCIGRAMSVFSRECAVILWRNMSAYADQDHAPSLTDVRLERTKEKARHLLMSCSFFLVCHWEVFLVALQFVIIYKAGECSSEEEVYILIGVYRCKTVLGGNSRQQLNCNHNQSCHLT